MWDKYRFSAVGNFYMRKIALLIVAGLMSALFVAIANSHPTYADDATWSGDSISYGGNTYTKLQSPPALPNLDPSYAQIYQRQDGAKADIIALKDDSDKTKPITDAEYITYDINSGQYSNPSPPATVTVDASGGGNGNGNSNGNQTSCGVKSIGWMLCGISRFFAGAMDKAYDWVSSFLAVKPISTDTSSGLYKAWDIARGFANLCFIVAFLLVIYSQITSVGISNYEIKKMIPKLIIAAILVNVSYFVCAVAVDLSNILGDSVQKALIDIRNSLPAPKAQTTWGGLTDLILSGATVGTIAGIAITSTTGVIALVPLLVPILISGVISVLVALLVLAARQALITVLIIISPLAFVAYLLPNTEKMFGKWRELFTNMMLIFPMFSLLFGGSQLAAYLIIQNTDQIQVVLLAMFVQVAPLAITPFLLRISHNLLSTLGNQVNGRKSGLVGKSREWAKERSDQLANKRAAAAASKTGFRPSRLAYKRRASKIHRDNMNKVYMEQIEAQAATEHRAHDIIVRQKEAELQKNAGHAVSERMFEEKKADPASAAMRRDDGDMRLAQMQTKALQAQSDSAWEEMKSRNMTGDNAYRDFAQSTRAVAETQRIADGRMAAAQAMQKIEHANDLIKSEALQNAVGGIADHGSQRALAAAVSEYRKDYNDRISEASAILKHWNMSSKDRQDHALGKDVVVFDDENRMKILRKDSLFTREAAIEAQLSSGTYAEIEQIIERSGSDLERFKTTIAQAVAENRLSSKAVFLGGKTIDDTGQGRITGMDALMIAVTSTLAKGKISSSDLATNDSKALERILQAATARDRTGLNATEAASLDASVEALKASARSVLTNPTVGRDLKENSRKVLEQMANL